jgi:purine-nucleoside phosphorylase
VQTAQQDQTQAPGTTDGAAASPTWQEAAAAAADVIRARSGSHVSPAPSPAVAGASTPAVDTAVVLGSGWGQAADLLGEVVADLEAAAVPGFHASGVAGHHGRLRVVSTPHGRRVLLIAARTHLYEGYGVDAVAHGVRTAAALGARHVVLTNGCGSLVPEWEPGTAVLIRDHLNLTGATPLRGATFVDLTDAYSPRLRALAHELDPDLPEGVYAQMHGPAYETPAEIAMVRAVGGQLVGMSTALETIAARALGLEVLGLSLVTNAAAGTTGDALDHQEVLDTGRAAAERCGRLLADVVDRVAGS